MPRENLCKINPDSASLLPHRRLGAALFIIIALTACGQSKDQQREQIIQCSGFQAAIMVASMATGMGAAPTNTSFTTTYSQALQKDGFTGLEIPNGAVQQYSQSLDPAKVNRLQQEGGEAAGLFFKNNDASGAVKYYENCISTFKDLGK